METVYIHFHEPSTVEFVLAIIGLISLIYCKYKADSASDRGDVAKTVYYMGSAIVEVIIIVFILAS